MSILMFVGGNVWADDPFYTLTPASGSNNAYNGNCDVAINGITWNITGNSTMQPWRLGGKSLNGVDRTVYSKTPMGSAINKVELEVGTANLTVNSITLTVASDAEFSDVIEEQVTDFTASSTITFEPVSAASWDNNAYYQFTFNLTNTTTSNKYVQFTSAKFYAAESSADTPSISADNVEIEYNATSGEIAYTVNNPVTGGSVSAANTSDWLTLGSATSSPVSFTCSANSEAAERTATVTLTYTYGTETATKNVTVTQAGNPDVINSISDITAEGTYAVQGTIVAKSNRGFIVGDGTGYIYYYNQNYDQNSYNIGDKVKLSGSVIVYNGVFEFNNLTTITAATESNYVEENPTVISGSDFLR